MPALRDPLTISLRCLRLAAAVPDAALAMEMRSLAHELHRLAVELEATTMHLDAVALRHRISDPQATATVVQYAMMH